MIRNVIFDYGRVLLDYSPFYLYDGVFDDKQQLQWFVDNVVNAEFHDRLDLGEPCLQVIGEWQQRFPQYSEQLLRYDTDYLKLIGDEVPGMRALIKDLKAMGMATYGLSNWGHKFFDLIYPRYDIFRMLDGQVVSGQVKVIKPDRRIFEILLDKYSLKPEESVFVDDREDNVQAARQLGIHGVVFHDADALRGQLAALIDLPAL